uniref:Serine/threonine-protein phosphatase PGAM5, mitochondrial n=1 Tax=Glossina palpalis gambiensis TaxID=67801 RepID=A0A1B0C742_9MUSC
MVAWSSVRKFTAIALGTGAGLGAYLYHRLGSDERKVHALWTISDTTVNPYALWDSNWDYRSPRYLVKPIVNTSTQEENRYNDDIERVTPRSVRHIILVRHAEYLHAGDTDDTHNLTMRGCVQAKYTGRRLRELGVRWDKIIISTMTRAQETADIILKEIDFDPERLVNCSYIREGAPIPPQPPVGHWRPPKAFFRDGARIEAAFRRYFHRALPTEKEDTYTLIVGHGNVIRYFVCRALQFPPEAWLRININHASITWLTIHPSGNVTIECLGDSGFMPPEYLTNRVPVLSKGLL